MDQGLRPGGPTHAGEGVARALFTHLPRGGRFLGSPYPLSCMGFPSQASGTPSRRCETSYACLNVLVDRHAGLRRHGDPG